MIITNNILAQNAQRNYRISTDKKTKAMNRLSSGYRINKAADDAAGLTISEHMREQIRGLNKGVDNAQDGISWVQTGDSALQEVQDMIHRMSELTVQSLNDTNTKEDKAALQMEFDALQSDIDRITKTTQFNTKNIFSEHMSDYYQMEGNAYWGQGSTHTVNAPDNQLIVNYVMKEGEAPKTATLTIPEGIYTTQELIDELDTQLDESGAKKDGLVVEYTDEGTCNINLEGGSKIESVGGGLSYLVYDMYNGDSVGALIGTTVFANDDVKLGIVSGKNDELEFQITDFGGTTSNKKIKVPEGKYSRPEIIDYLNSQLSGTGVEAVKFSTGIKLKSDTSVITGFKGNMFKIDGGSPIYNSIFYDNIMYGNVSKTQGVYQGGAVINTDSKDEQHNHYTIDSSNNTLIMSANGGGDQTLVIPDGEYTVSQMADKLNELFRNNGINVTADLFSSGTFLGLKLASQESGFESTISFDTGSSAYATLFTKCNYTTFNNNADIYSDTKNNKVPSFTSGKEYLTSSGTLPLTITAGINDKMSMKLTDNNGTGTSYDITLDAGNYNSLNDIVNQINEQLNGTSAPAGYKGKLQVSTSGNKLYITGTAGSEIKQIGFSAVSGNTGYEDIFVGKNVTATKSTVQGTGSITLKESISNPVNIDSGNNTFKVKINGVDRNVTLTTESRTHEQIKDEINNQLRGTTTETWNQFTSFNANGSTTYNKINKQGSGNTTVGSVSCNATGSSKQLEGAVGKYDYNNPAAAIMDKVIPGSVTIGSSNNSMIIVINGVSHELKLKSGVYDRNQLKDELQKQINTNYGTGLDGADVTLTSDNKLNFTARIKNGTATKDGAETNISFSSTNSSFLKELCTTRTAGTITTPAIPASFAVDDTHNTFTFKYNTGAGETTANITLANGTYTRDNFISELNKQLSADGIAVKADLNGNGIRLTTVNEGNGYKVSYVRDSESAGGSLSQVLFGDYSNNMPAAVTTDRAIQSSIEIDDSSNEFSINVNGVQKNVTLDNGIYNSRSDFVEMLNNKLSGSGVVVSLNGDKLKYETTAKGRNASLSMTYATGGSSMAKIYGKTIVKTPGATADFNSSTGQLVLTAENSSHSLYVDSDNGGIFLKSTKTTSNINPTSTDGYLSNVKSYVDGVNISQPITLNRWNSELNFDYIHNGVTTSVRTLLTEKTYTFDELRTELQSALDTAAGSGELNVTVDGSGVKIECTNLGNIYKMNSFSGGFYNKVMCSSTDKATTKGVTYKAGGQNVNDAYAIGRKDIRNNSTEIERNLNDEFTFDFKDGTSNYTFTMKLDEGVYNGRDLCNALQTKLNEQLTAAGLNENLIKCSIGGVNSGVIGSNDSNALCLIMDKDVSAPEEGECIIDGVRGNAAFHIFYQSDGKMTQAYTKGSKDVTKGIEITSENNELKFEADGTEYSIKLEEKKYTQDELIDELNNKLDAASSPVQAKMDGKVVKLEYKSYGEHFIDKVAGSARNSIFYQENSGDGKKNDINIQLSGMAGNPSTQAGRDYMTIDRKELNTAFMDINSIVITKNKYAEKALGRLNKALDIVSKVRSGFGAEQNRLEHAINNNNNTSENTQFAETQIRDTDMSVEAVEMAKYNILQQTGQAMMAQANSMTEGVLKMLQ